MSINYIQYNNINIWKVKNAYIICSPMLLYSNHTWCEACKLLKVGQAPSYDKTKGWTLLGTWVFWSFRLRQNWEFINQGWRHFPIKHWVPKDSTDLEYARKLKLVRKLLKVSEYRLWGFYCTLEVVDLYRSWISFGNSTTLQDLCPIFNFWQKTLLQ